MKKTLLTLAIFLTGIITASAQLTQGSVKYSMDFSTDDPDMEMAIAMMAGSELNVYFYDDKSRADVSMGSMMNLVTVTDSKSDEFLMLMDISMMGMKYAVRSNMDELEKMNDDGDEPELDIELLDESKKILGYDCKKAVIADEEGNEMTFWYTEEIEVNKKGQTYLRDDVPGLPLEYEMLQQGMKIKLTATELNDSIKKKDAQEIFSLDIPEGYEEKSIEELLQMGMGG